MRLCRFRGDRLGLVADDEVIDVSAALSDLPAVRWARSIEDPVMARLADLMPRIEAIEADAPRLRRVDLALDPPVALPSKIIGAPVNYHAHLAEAETDRALHQGRTVHPIDEIGCFLKAGSALVGDGAVITLPEGAERVDHEAEVAVVIGAPAKAVKSADAMAYVAGYTLALDMTVRGKQDRSMRKSCDGFAVLGPWLTTADDINNPADIAFSLTVNGTERQASSTELLIRSIPELIEMCSSFYTLLPGDVIMTGTPAGVGPVVSGDRIEVHAPALGTLRVSIQ